MAQNEFIAVKSDGLSRHGDPRYIVINRETREVVDDAHGNGYKSPKAAHASWSFKQKWHKKLQN